MGMIVTDRRASDEVGRDEVRVCVRDEGLGRDALETPMDTRVSAGHGPYVVAAAAATLGETDRLHHHDKPAHPTLREEDGAEEMDDETGGCADAAHAAAETFAAWVTRRIDLLLGLAFLGVALWLRAVVLIGARRSSPLARDEHAWRWVLFVACVFLGRYLARSLVSFAVFVLDRYVRACSTTPTSSTPPSITSPSSAPRSRRSSSSSASPSRGQRSCAPCARLARRRSRTPRGA